MMAECHGKVRNDEKKGKDEKDKKGRERQLFVFLESAVDNKARRSTPSALSRGS
jgi:hypothetical protein